MLSLFILTSKRCLSKAKPTPLFILTFTTIIVFTGCIIYTVIMGYCEHTIAIVDLSIALLLLHEYKNN